MKLARKYTSRSIADPKRAISIRVEGDIVILRSENGIIEIFEDHGKLYGISMNLQPVVIKAELPAIDEAMRYFSFYPEVTASADVMTVQTDQDEDGEPVKAKRPYVRRKV